MLCRILLIPSFLDVRNKTKKLSSVVYFVTALPSCRANCRGFSRRGNAPRSAGRSTRWVRFPKGTLNRHHNRICIYFRRPVSRRRRCQVPHPDAAPLPRVLPLQETPAKPSSSSAVPVSQIPTPDHNTENDEVSSNNFSDLPLSIDVTSAKANISSPVTFGVREATRRVIKFPKTLKSHN